MHNTFWRTARLPACALGVLAWCRLAPAAETVRADQVTWYEALARFQTMDISADRAWLNCEDADAVRAHGKALREGMLRAIGPLPARGPLQARVTGTERRAAYSIESVVFASRPNFYLTGLFYRPLGRGPFPAVAVTCGHSENGKACNKYQRWALSYAKAGIAAFVYDPIDQGERIFSPRANCQGHNQIGARATLLGSSFSAMRIYDAMRVFDYLASRPDVDAERLGLSGQSGGGTMTSLVMALEPRVKAATPSCYLSTLRGVCASIGPQDAEQCIWNQLAFGLNHLGFICARAPMPVLMLTKTQDFFPLSGAKATASAASRVFAAVGAPGAFRRFESDGPHGVSESATRAAVAWMRTHLKGEADAWRDALIAELPKGDRDFRLEEADCGIPEKDVSVCPGASVTNMPGARTVYDLLRDDAAAFSPARAALPPHGAARADLVRRVAGIRSFDELVDVQVSTNRDGVTIARTDAPTLEGSFTEPAVRDASRRPVLLVFHAGWWGGAKDAARRLAAEGRPSLDAEIRNMGRYFGCRFPYYSKTAVMDGVAMLEHMMGRNFVSLCAEDVALFARELSRRHGGPVDVVAKGPAAIAVAHAVAAYPALFADVSMIDPPASWCARMADASADVPFAEVVRGALRHYDWTDLVPKGE